MPGALYNPPPPSPQPYTDLRLLEENALLRVDPAGQQAGGHVQDALPQAAGVLGDGDGVEVHDAVQYRAELILQLRPALECAQVVPQVGDPGGLYPGEDAEGGGTLQHKKHEQRYYSRRSNGGLRGRFGAGILGPVLQVLPMLCFLLKPSGGTD